MKALADIYAEEQAVVQPLRRLYFELAKNLVRQGRYEKAMKHLAEALEEPDASVDDWKIYYLLHDVYSHEGNPEKTKSNLLKLIATAPPNIAEALMRTHDIYAVLAGEAGEKKAGEDVLMLQGKAHLLKTSGQINEAMVLWQQALQKAEEAASEIAVIAVQLDMAEAWIEEGAIEDAAAILKSIPALPNRDLEIRWQLLHARLLILRKDTDTAIAIADRQMQQQAAHQQPGLIKLQALIVDRKYKEAQAFLHQLLAVYPVNDDLLFYKAEILLEGHVNTEEAEKLLLEIKERSGISFIKDKLKEAHIRFRPQHGNDNYFLAQVYRILHEDFTTDAALQQADLALQEQVHFDGYAYPHGVIYELKAELLLRQQQWHEAARFYYLSGKEHYWNSDYTKADALFAACYNLEKEKQLFPPFIDNYWYYADSRVQLSYTRTSPYVDEGIIREAARIWYEAYAKQKPSFNDAWAYLTATLIHEQLSKLAERNKQEDLFYCWFYAEHNLLIDNTNPKAWGFISRAFRSNGLDRNAAILAQKAYELDKEEFFFWDEKATTLLNIGAWEEADEFLKKLLTQFPDERVYKAYKAYALYHLAQFNEGSIMMNEVVEVHPDWMWARHLRMIINWMRHDTGALQEDAAWIWERKEQPEFKNTTTHEFAYAAYFLGYVQQAEKLFEIAQDDNFDELISSLFFYTLYHLQKGAAQEAQHYYTRYKKEARHVYNFTELKNAIASLCPHRTDLMEDLDQAAIARLQKPIDLEEELRLFSRNCNDCSITGSIGWEAINLSFLRLAAERQQWSKAVAICLHFQKVPHTRVDNYHLWNRFYLSLKVFFQQQPKAFLAKAVRQDMQQYAAASPYDNIEALADLYTILSITGRQQSFKEKAAHIYARAGLADAMQKFEEWQKTVAELLPELRLNWVESTSSQPRLTECPQCGNAVVSSTQRFCFSCGSRL